MVNKCCTSLRYITHLTVADITPIQAATAFGFTENETEVHSGQCGTSRLTSS